MSPSELRPRPAHRPVAELRVPTAEWTPLVEAYRALPANVGIGDELVQAAEQARALLPPAVRRALDAHAADAGPAACLLLRGVPTGSIPATPQTPASPSSKDRLSELVLIVVGRTLGEPVGYAPEHGGALVQNLVPTRDAALLQTSTSSAVELEFHTETAFHPHRPRHVLLLCLRGDPAARTLLCDVDEVLDDLTPDVRRTLHECRFRTGVDESFGGGGETPPGPLVSVLGGDPARPTLLFDASLMRGEDPHADAALAAFAHAARARRAGLVLEAGDLLVVDNHRCIHGRSAFRARHDGTDRWLQRSLVVEDLRPSTDDRVGRIISTAF